ncbi:MAG: hypothetical protein RQ741_06080 [Wenzhouxiangellaceae bacterium]|nr:hypothetical protein [Wenzhouxiangellaceae bacterium]
MNKSPEGLGRELRNEELIAGRLRPDDPELAADWALKQELSRLDDQMLPAALRQRVLSAVRTPRHGAAWRLAAVAAVAALIVVAGVVRQPPGPQPDPAEFRLAINTIGDTSRRAVWLAARELPDEVKLPELGLDRLPYANVIRSILEAPGHPENQAKENHP